MLSSQRNTNYWMCHLAPRLLESGMQYAASEYGLIDHEICRGKLEQNLKLLGFNTILHFKPSSSLDEEEEGQGTHVGASEPQKVKHKSLQDKFKETVGERCKDGAIVFIFLSGLQFPLEVS